MIKKTIFLFFVTLFLNTNVFSQEVKMTRDDDIARLAEMKTYRGIRHRSGHKVRGQRLRSNGRSGLTLGVQRKK